MLVIERLPKRKRQEQLLQAIEANPFMTDEELMRHFQVSIQTVRLDRLELAIPELRERIKNMAVKTYDQVRSLPIDEIIGEVIDLQLNQSGISMFEIREEHVFSRTKIARGHHIFSQANSLAVAVINDPIALTASADIRFLRPVKLYEKCIAKAYVRSISKGKANVETVTYIGEEVVFRGDFVIFHSKKEQHTEGGNLHADSD
ncbi:transcription factor FapR [Paenibacillus eucommiae]|uniref:Transcription factor FapR n=1 Tax=Paenibacillus eucommiae TaxID=1355755 RepID=A0ABS4IUX6_9BACL|nr:transcription factor FapR [Paenibacillus eucommiae]MBP1991380.1 acyl-coenzyme A thioesterase PaaI-like protein [Paenibacillus eucommiae]